MASILVYDLQFNTVDVTSNLMEQVKKAEKRTFPKNEALDFDMELKKRNTELIVVLGDKEEDVDSVARPLAAYMVLARLHGIALLHKICVLEVYREQGVARKLISDARDKLQSQGCEKFQLWADEARMPARELYKSLGFRLVDRAADYYGRGRHGIKMVLELNSVW